MITMIRGEFFKNIPETDYFDTHYANFTNLQTNKIITHNSDWSTSQCLEINNNKHIFYNNENLVWFSQNVDIDHPRIKSLPIGLENSEWFKEIQKENKIATRNITEKEFLSIAKFNPGTHPDRKKILEYLQTTNWCLTQPTINGHDFDTYLNELNKSLTCVCPRGNGIDTHRIWEALYVGTIPIVEDCVNIRFYQDLPIIIVENLLNLTAELIVDKINELSTKQLNYNLLDCNYWKDYIINYEN